jgi:hypothetical protein
MKYLPVLILTLCIQVSTSAQEITKDLRSFSRIIASPRVHVILKKGNHENIRLVYHDVNESRINAFVKGKTLHIFLDHARKVERTVATYDGHGSRGVYDGVSVTAYVTYQDLEYLEIRGNQELTCNDPIDAKKFVVRAYGENEITFASLKTDFFKAALYGENKLRIKSGKVIDQRYRLFGENKIYNEDLKSAFTSTSIFGEAQLQINSSEEVVVTAFGEPVIDVNGGAHINRRLIFGKASISAR